MKMSLKHFAALEKAVVPVDTEPNREAYRTGKFPRADKTQDVNKRYRWDILWHVRMPQEWWDEVYACLVDAHIDTALRSIVKPL